MENHEEKKKYKCGGGCHFGELYGLGFIGAAVYFIQNADTFWMGAFGLLKALFWPAFLVYKALELLNI